MNIQFEYTLTLAAAEETTSPVLAVNNAGLLSSIEIQNTDSTNPTTAFSVEAQDHPNGEFYPLVSGSDFATPTSFLRYSSSNVPNALVHGTRAHLRLDLSGIYALRFKATSTLGAALVIRGSVAVINRN